MIIFLKSDKKLRIMLKQIIRCRSRLHCIFNERRSKQRIAKSWRPSALLAGSRQQHRNNLRVSHTAHRVGSVKRGRSHENLVQDANSIAVSASGTTATLQGRDLGAARYVRQDRARGRLQGDVFPLCRLQGLVAAATNRTQCRVRSRVAPRQGDRL